MTRIRYISYRKSSLIGTAKALVSNYSTEEAEKETLGNSTLTQ